MSTTRLGQAGIGVKAYGTFLPKDAAVPPVTPVVAESYSGGFYEVPQMRRHRSVREERERLGIIPRKVKQIAQAVARASVVADKTDDQAQRQLEQRLAQQAIEANERYVQFMQQERDRILSRDIERALRIRKRQYELDEDDREAEMLLM